MDCSNFGVELGVKLPMGDAFMAFLECQPKQIYNTKALTGESKSFHKAGAFRAPFPVNRVKEHAGSAYLAPDSFRAQ